MNKFSISLIGLLLVGLLAGCKPEPPKAPRGYWEYRGETPGGYESVIRLSVDGGPFVRFFGCAPPPGKLKSKAEYDKLLKQFNAYWIKLPEMLTRFENNQFIGNGGEIEGAKLFEYDPATQEIITFQKGTEGLRLKRVTHFSPLKFPQYEKRCLEAKLPGWEPPTTDSTP